MARGKVFRVLVIEMRFAMYAKNKPDLLSRYWLNQTKIRLLRILCSILPTNSEKIRINSPMRYHRLVGRLRPLVYPLNDA